MTRPAFSIDNYHHWNTVARWNKKLVPEPEYAFAASKATMSYLMMQANLTFMHFGKPDLYHEQSIREEFVAWRTTQHEKPAEDTLPENQRAAMLMVKLDEVCRFISNLFDADFFPLNNDDFVFQKKHLRDLSVLDHLGRGSGRSGDDEEDSPPTDINAVCTSVESLQATDDPRINRVDVKDAEGNQLDQTVRVFVF